MYKIKVTSSFSAAHYLRNYQGKCETLHGHNWKVEVVVKSEELNPVGLVLDFKHLKTHLSCVLEELDHKLLNELEFFQNKNPSCELLAFYIFRKLKDRIPQDGNYYLSEVTVWEQAYSSATYSEE